MERRSFVELSVAAFGVPMTAPVNAEEAVRQLFELRSYTLAKAKRPTLDAYLKDAFLPAMKRIGVGPVGVFNEVPDRDEARVVVLIVHQGPATVVSCRERLAVDAEYVKAAAEYLGAKAADPVYKRIESSLLSAIAGMPKLEPLDAKQPRLFNLRVYESHNERAAAKKVEMFERGELAIFRRVGLTPVFFASSVVGASQPNLTYLLGFKNEAERKAAWDRFRGDPEWLKLKAIPEYADKEIVSKITNILLEPTPYSEI